MRRRDAQRVKRTDFTHQESMRRAYNSESQSTDLHRFFHRRQYLADRNTDVFIRLKKPTTGPVTEEAIPYIAQAMKSCVLGNVVLKKPIVALDGWRIVWKWSSYYWQEIITQHGIT